jgi:lysozyme
MLKGIDINSNNDVEDWQKVKDSGIQVVINKATEGNFYKDKYLNYRYPRVRTVGLKISFYHFAGKHGAVTEAEYFLDYIKNLKPDTILWLDIEQPPASYGWQWTKQTAVDYVNKFIPYIRSKGYDIGIYTGEYFYNIFLKGNISNNVKLWIAKYSSISPIGYPTNSWQYSESGSVPGIVGHVDMDYFNENILIDNVVQAVEKAQSPKYDVSIPPESDAIKHFLGSFYFEKRTDGNLGIHIDRGNYVVIGKGFIDLYWNDNKGNSGHKRIVG